MRASGGEDVTAHVSNRIFFSFTNSRVLSLAAPVHFKIRQGSTCFGSLANFSACLDEVDEFASELFCAEGAEGRLCQQCEWSYFFTSGRQCEPCKWSGMMTSTIILFVVGLFVVFLLIVLHIKAQELASCLSFDFRKTAIYQAVADPSKTQLIERLIKVARLTAFINRLQFAQVTLKYYGRLHRS